MTTLETGILRIHCSEVWGGVQNADLDVRTGALTASLYSSVSDGRKGGDIYYFSVCNQDLFTRIAVADVMGHGEAVSQISQWLYAALVARMNSLDGKGILAELNAMVFDRGFEAMTTAAVLGFYATDGNLYFSYAGHPPALIKRRQDKSWWRALLRPHTEPANLPLGTMRVDYHQDKISLGRGDRIMLYTDGLVEAPNADERPFGEEQLLDTLDDAAEQSLVGLKNTVLDSVRGHTGDRSIPDDVTLMVIEVL